MKLERDEGVAEEEFQARRHWIMRFKKRSHFYNKQ
jgi:hypothetical protein